MHLGLAQINPHLGAIDRNLQVILSYIEEARQAGCDLVVFPELAICGYPPLDLLWRSGFVEKIEGALGEIARASEGIGVIVGGVSSRAKKGRANLVDRSSLSDGAGIDLFNKAFLFVDGALVGEEAKLMLPTFDVYSEERYFTPAPGAQVFEFRGMRFGINICEDLWIDDGPTDTQASLGADWVINISASPFFAGKGAIRRRLASRRAVENGVTLLHVNLVGAQDELVYDGGSFIMGPSGDLLYQAPYFDEGLFILDTEKLVPIVPQPQPEIESIQRAIVVGIHDYLDKNGFSRVIIGLSGGIDSALVAALAVEALGKEKVTAVFLPSEITSQESRDDATTLAHRLGIEFLDVGIAEVIDACHSALPQRLTGLPAENLQARTRGTLLMALANERNALVLATGNKSEIAVGYNTLYGDTVGAIAPIADLYKTQVYQLAKALGETIPQNIVEKAPTAELRPGQRDEDDLPPYALLDAILLDLIEKNASRKDLIASGFPEKIVTDILSRYYKSEYKRRQLPLGIKVSPKAFGIGRRMPITHVYRA